MQRKSSRKSSEVGEERRRRRFAERDQRIRKEATALFLERGLNGFSMEDVASAIDYSKGTVYQHYTSKEDVLVAVLVDHLAEETKDLEAVAVAPICPRARIRAGMEVDLAYTDAHPEVLQLATVFIVPQTLAKAPPERGQALHAAYDRTNAVEGGFIREAISRGDLVVPAGRRAEHVRYALSALSFGSTYIAAQGRRSNTYRLADMRPIILANLETLLDGFAWKPLFASPAYQADVARLDKLLAELRAGRGGR